ncbi:hypothetical protein D6D21_10170 [Aureobasidium pullulans]|uniref:Uncharacterized protein n=1 Tax=Aureobasidium pullulans TaxID=5580 RepID=A0AB74IJ04_AURPU|nr:hypothetical protein D6D21_10170 [Aureobasidium pullulans]
MEFLHQYNEFDEAILQRQYNYFKGKPGKSVIETRVKLMTLMPSRVQVNSNHEQGNWDSLKAPDDISTGRYLEKYLTKALHPISTDAHFQICFLIISFGTARNHFSIWQSAIESFRGCQRDMHLAPARVIARCVEEEWDLKDICKPGVHQSSSILPSKKLHQDVNLLFGKTETTYEMHWQSDLLTYTNDVSVYVWQPHLEEIPTEHYNSITIVVPSDDVSTTPAVSPSYRMLVVANPPALMSRFLNTQDAFVASANTTHAWDAGHERFRVFLIFLKLTVEDSSGLVDSMAAKTSEMMYKGRRRPTRSNIQYLVHLDDCRRLAIKDLWHINTLVDKARSTVEANTFCCNQSGSQDKAKAIEVLSGFQDDIIFLVNSFEALEKALLVAREQIKEQMELAQGQRTLIITIAAAFFIPLGFIAVSLTYFMIMFNLLIEGLLVNFRHECQGSAVSTLVKQYRFPDTGISSKCSPSPYYDRRVI